MLLTSCYRQGKFFQFQSNPSSQEVHSLTASLRWNVVDVRITLQHFGPEYTGFIVLPLLFSGLLHTRNRTQLFNMSTISRSFLMEVICYYAKASIKSREYPLEAGVSPWFYMLNAYTYYFRT